MLSIRNTISIISDIRYQISYLSYNLPCFKYQISDIIIDENQKKLYKMMRLESL